MLKLAKPADEAQRFLAAVAASPYLWHSIDIRVMAVYIDGAWQNIATRCYLDPRSMGQVERFSHLPATEYLSCWQSILSVRSLPAVLNSVAEGMLQIKNVDVHYLSEVDSPTRERASYSNASYYFSLLSSQSRKVYPPWSAHGLIMSGPQIDDLLRRVPLSRSELDNSIRALKHPYDGLDGLAKDVLGFIEPLQSGRSATFEIFAPLQGRFKPEECRLDQGVLSLSILTDSITFSKHCNVGFVATEAGAAPVSDTVELHSEKWISSGSQYLFKGERPMAASRVTLFLRTASAIADTLTLVDISAEEQNARITAYQVFDPDLDLFRSSLKPARSGAGDFERAVGRLLHFWGFNVDVLAGSSRLGDAVDVIGYAYPLPAVLAVECTLGSIGAGGKLGKLVARTTQIRQALPGYEVIGVIVTALRRSDVSKGELSAASADGLAVLTQEDLEQLLEFLSTGKSLSHLLELIRSKVPSMGALDRWIGQ